MQQAYSIYETKTHLSRVLKSIKNGHEVIITDRGNPIAKIIAIQPHENSFEQRIHQLIKNGNILPTKKSRMTLGKKLVAGGLQRFLEERE